MARPSISRNAFLTLLASAVPLLAAVLSMPHFAAALGPDRLGMLSIVWMLIGYVTILEFGLGLAVTKVLAGLLATGNQERIASVFWSGFWGQVVLGTFAGGVLWATSGLLVETVLKVPRELIPEVETTLLVCAGAMPFVFVSSSVVGVLQGSQRFDLAAAVSLPMSTAQYLVPLVVSFYWQQLPLIVVSILLTRVLGLTGQFGLACRIVPTLRTRITFRWADLRTLLAFGGWVTVSNVVSPIMVYMDRLLVGAIVSLAAVAYYAVPADAAGRLLILPASLMVALFPVFAELSEADNPGRIAELAASAAKYTILGVGLPVTLLCVFARDIMDLWMGPDFAEQSTTAARILLVGVLASAVARIPYGILQSSGRPDLIAKLHLIELPIFAAILPALTYALGIPGAAIAWSIRTTMDMALLLWMSHRHHVLAGSVFRAERIPSILVFLGVLGVSGWLLLGTLSTIEQKAFLAASLGLAGAIVTWFLFINARDRRAMVRVFQGTAL